MTAHVVTGADAEGWPGPAAHHDAVLDRTCALWTVFFLAISMAIWQHVSDHAERVAWLLADFVGFCLIFRYQSQFINLALGNIVYVSWPLLACVSAVWSTSATLTLYSGLQFVMTTVIAFLICIQLRLEQIVAVIFWAMLSAAGIALATAVVDLSVAIDYVGSWRGGFPTKNVMGDAMILLVLCACCLFLQGRWRTITALAAVVGIILIFLTRSATPIVSVFISLAPLPFAYAYLRGKTSFLVLTGLALLVTGIAGASAYIATVYFHVDVIGDFLASLGKERTLTGRTVLWNLAREAIDERPWLGFGYNGYWVNPPSGMLQVRAAFGQELTFFHNNYLEVAVAYGVIGPVLLTLGIIIAFLRCIRRVLLASSPIEFWPLLVVIQVTIQTFVQYPLMTNHSMWHVVFLIAAIARK